jgi:dihydroneopterin triphosphate diphosphatase
VTTIRVSLVDVYIVRRTGGALECLALRRAAGGRCPGSWESVHGHIDAEEKPHAAAIREVEEETGLTPLHLYNLSRVELFYQHRLNEVALIPVFVALVEQKAAVRLSAEHDTFEWLQFESARQRLAWPRERRALDDIEMLLAQGDAGQVDDVLRVC